MSGKTAEKVTKQAPEDKYATPEAKIDAMLKLRANGLFVNRMDFVDALITDYNKRAGDLKLAGVIENAREQAEAQLEQARVAIQDLKANGLVMTDRLIALQHEVEQLREGDTRRAFDIAKLTVERDAASQELAELKEGLVKASFGGTELQTMRWDGAKSVQDNWTIQVKPAVMPTEDVDQIVKQMADALEIPYVPKPENAQ